MKKKDTTTSIAAKMRRLGVNDEATFPIRHLMTVRVYASTFKAMLDQWYITTLDKAAKEKVIRVKRIK